MQPRIYKLLLNADRDDYLLTFDHEVPVGTVLKIEDEFVWHFPPGVFSRGVMGSKRDRYFEGTIAKPAGIAMPDPDLRI